MPDITNVSSTVWVAAIDHDDGTDLYAAATEALLYEALAAWCIKRWSKMGPDARPTCEFDDRKIVEAYFAREADRGFDWCRKEEVTLFTGGAL